MIVLDASAAVNMVRNTPEGNALYMLMTPEEEVFAPSLYKAEITTALWKYARGGFDSKERTIANISIALRYVTDYVDIEDCCIEAACEALRFEHSPYDMFYLILARRTGATLFTLDNKLMELAEQCGVDCVQPVDWKE